jgi:hypothetical protein
MEPPKAADYLFAGDGPVGVFCKGDLSYDDFLAAVRTFDAREHEDNADTIAAGLVEIRHAVVRCIPVKDEVIFVPSDRGRGAFDITFIDYEDALDFEAKESER